jgi:LmbE family N-acetylglucosaminyl deacetylase
MSGAPEHGADSLELLAWARERHGAGLTIVVAHPDDEVLGAGAQLPDWPAARFIHVTDGAPADLWDATLAGFCTREDYARERRRELRQALEIAGLQNPERVNLRLADQEVSLGLTALSLKLQRVFSSTECNLVLTHPYEGGHPDHDSTAFALHCAVQRMGRAGSRPVILEMSSYFNRAGIMATGEFLPGSGPPPSKWALNQEQREFKQRLLRAFATQRKVLEHFPVNQECFRLAPDYNFRQPPHPGRLYYEMFDWGMSGERWRRLAEEALEQLTLVCA